MMNTTKSTGRYTYHCARTIGHTILNYWFMEAETPEELEQLKDRIVKWNANQPESCHVELVRVEVTPV